MPKALDAQTVVGHVLDGLSARPLAATVVTLLDSAGTTVGHAESDSTGLFVLRAPGAGRYQVHIDQLGYDPVGSETLTLRTGGRMELLLHMVPAPVELDPMAVSVRRQEAKLARVGFYRREIGVGDLIDPDAVRDRSPFVTTDLLRHLPGVKLVEVHAAGGYVPASARWAFQTLDSTSGDTGACLMKVVVDGFEVPMDTGFGLDELVPVQDVLAVEVYSGLGGVGAPAQYRISGANCGVILIWTK